MSTDLNHRDYEKAHKLNVANMDHVVSILGLRGDEIEDFEGTWTDRVNLIDYRIDGHFVQVKGMHQGFDTFTLPEDHLPKLQENIAQGYRFPEFHVEIQFEYGEPRAIAAIRTQDLINVFEGKIPAKFIRRFNHTTGEPFLVVYWKDLPEELFNQTLISRS